MRITKLALAMSVLTALAACHKGGHDDDTEVDTQPVSDDSGADDTGETSLITSQISGNVSVVLYTLDEDGERIRVEWADSTCGDSYGFGKVFVAAYHEGEAGERIYLDEYTVDAPTTGAMPYSLDLETDGEQDVYVYAVVDYWGDRVIGTNDPIGAYPSAIRVTDGGAFGDVELEVLVPECYTSDGPGCGSHTLAGQSSLTGSWAGGEVATMLVSLSDQGPYHSTWDTPANDGGGASADFALGVCNNYGESKLIGAWDANGNDLADPLDQWGALISEPNVDGNPIDIGAADQSGLEVQIPLGDGAGIGVVPFVRLSGDVSVGGGTFDDLPVGSTLHVAALKYRPGEDVSVEDLEDGYDVAAYEWSDLQGNASVSYSVTVPANTIAYLWAYVDTDGDKVVNEAGEPLAAGGTSGNGKTPTGTENTSGLDMVLNSPGAN